MATKSKPPAKVPIDTKTAVKLEAKLRNGLTGSPAHIIDGPAPEKKKTKSATIELDGATVARFADYLRRQLIASEAHIFEDGEEQKKKK